MTELPTHTVSQDQIYSDITKSLQATLSLYNHKSSSKWWPLASPHVCKLNTCFCNIGQSVQWDCCTCIFNVAGDMIEVLIQKDSYDYILMQHFMGEYTLFRLTAHTQTRKQTSHTHTQTHTRVPEYESWTDFGPFALLCNTVVVVSFGE